MPVVDELVGGGDFRMLGDTFVASYPQAKVRPRGLAALADDAQCVISCIHIGAFIPYEVTISLGINRISNTVCDNNAHKLDCLQIARGGSACVCRCVRT